MGGPARLTSMFEDLKAAARRTLQSMATIDECLDREERTDDDFRKLNPDFPGTASRVLGADVRANNLRMRDAYRNAQASDKQIEADMQSEATQEQLATVSKTREQLLKMFPRDAPNLLDYDEVLDKRVEDPEIVHLEEKLQVGGVDRGAHARCGGTAKGDCDRRDGARERCTVQVARRRQCAQQAPAGRTGRPGARVAGGLPAGGTVAGDYDPQRHLLQAPVDQPPGRGAQQGDPAGRAERGQVLADPLADHSRDHVLLQSPGALTNHILLLSLLLSSWLEMTSD
jgi:hypothetical protein